MCINSNLSDGPSESPKNKSLPGRVWGIVSLDAVAPYSHACGINIITYLLGR